MANKWMGGMPSESKKNGVQDAQLHMKGFCPCGRPNGKYPPAPRYCSRYCFEFMTKPAEGFKKKTRYECWRGTGTYSYNPVYPKIDIKCPWCHRIFKLSRSIKDWRRIYCENDCRRQAERNARRTSKRNGAAAINHRVRIMRLMRFYEGDMTAQQVATHFREWFGMSCPTGRAASLFSYLVKKGWITKIQENPKKPATYRIKDKDTPLKLLFGEEVI